MLKSVFSRRRFLGQVSLLLVMTGFPLPSAAAAEPPVNDVLSGVGDASQRQWLRENSGKGHWDGKYWNYEGKRYTSGQYRDHLLSNYKAPSPQSKPPLAAPRKNYSQPYRPGTPAPRPGMVPNPPGAPIRYNPNKAFPRNPPAHSGFRSGAIRR